MSDAFLEKHRRRDLWLLREPETKSRPAPLCRYVVLAYPTCPCRPHLSAVRHVFVSASCWERHSGRDLWLLPGGGPVRIRQSGVRLVEKLR